MAPYPYLLGNLRVRLIITDRNKKAKHHFDNQY